MRFGVIIIGMSQIVDQSLQKIAKGTGAVFLGTIVALLLAFAGRVLIGRFFTQSEYGIFSLAAIVLNIVVVISTLGLQEGAPRQIAFYRGKNDGAKAQAIVHSSIWIALVASIPLSLVLFFVSDILSTSVFHSPELATALRVFSIAIPFTVLLNIFASVFRGFDKVGPKIYFVDILRNGLFPLLLIPVILLGLSFSQGLYAYMVSSVLACIAFAIYSVRKSPFPIITGRISRVINPLGKELLLFSLPLLVLTMLSTILFWTDTLVLGYFKTPDLVGLYNAASPLANLIPIMLTSLGFIYVPIITQLYSQGLMVEVKRTYQVLTRWIFAASFPLFLFLFLFPDTILTFFFGASYVEAALALKILSVGLMFHTFFGANAMTLLVMGNTKLLMWASLLAAGANVALNISLIPIWGITGAALASLISYSATHIFMSVKLYQLSRMHPFTENCLKLMGCSLIISALIYLISFFVEVTFWMLPLFGLGFILGYFILLLLTKSLDKEDVALILAMEKGTGMNAAPIKRILERFS